MADLQYNNIYHPPGFGLQIGQAISNGMMGARAYRDRMAQVQEQNQWHRAQYELEQQKQAQQAPYIQAQIQNMMAEQAHRQAQAEALKAQQTAGNDLASYVQQQGVMATGPQGRTMDGEPYSASDPKMANAIQSAIAGRQAFLASMHPQNIGEQVPQIQTGMDPRMRAMMATRTPMMMNVGPGHTIYDIQSSKPEYTAPEAMSGNNLSFDQRLQLRDVDSMDKMLAAEYAAQMQKVGPGEERPNPQAAAAYRQSLLAQRGRPIRNTATNPQTGQKIVVESSDGGKTWNPVQGPQQQAPVRPQIQAPELSY